MADEKVIDGYWKRMGKLAVEALGDVLRDDLTPRRREITAEYLGGIMEHANEMGMRFGKLSAQFENRESE